MCGRTVNLCRVCRTLKPAKEFYRNPATVGGLQNICKACVSAAAKKYREASTAKLKARQKEYARANKDKVEANNRKYKVLKAKKLAARKTMTNAIYAGILVRQPCEVCGTNSNIHGHHEDYDKPLDVIWLCRKHHTARHAEMLANAEAELRTSVKTEAYKN